MESKLQIKANEEGNKNRVLEYMEVGGNHRENKGNTGAPHNSLVWREFKRNERNYVSSLFRILPFS